PYLMVADKRHKGAAATHLIAHADIDNGLFDSDKAAAIGAFAVASGTEGNAHAYVALAESVPEHWHTVLCRGLGAYLGAVDSKIADNDLLRPPGTWNHKGRAHTAGGESSPVHWLIRPDGTVWEAEALAHVLGVTLPPRAATAPVSGSAPSTHIDLDVLPLDTLPDVVAALGNITGDRSTDTMRVVGACRDSGLTLAQARYAVSTRADLAERLAERPDDDVLTCWLKAVDDRQARIVTEVSQEEFGTTSSSSREGVVPEGGNFSTAVEKLSSVGMPRIWAATDLKAAAQPRWLAKGRLPRGAISLLVGDEGIGKSLLWVWIAAAITTGRALPEFGIPARDPGRVLIVITEDVWAEIVLPRLQVAGADIAMIDVICTEDDGSGAPVFPRDCHLIVNADPAPVLVVVDAWLDTVPPSLSVRDPQQARQALHPWKEVATITEAAILLLTHTNRVTSISARDKYGATGELRKKARMTLYAQTDEAEHLVVGPEKMNSAKALPASMFTIRAVQHFTANDDHDGTVPHLVYAGESEMTARELLAENMVPAAGTDDALAWLAEYLGGGPRWATEVFEAAKGANISEKKARTAKNKLHVEATRNGSTGPWFWRLPQHHGVPDALQMPPSPAMWASGNVGESGKSHIPPTTSQDSLMTNGEIRGHLGNTENEPQTVSGLCFCGYPPPEGMREHHDCERERKSQQSGAA
ncbi:MAG: AAA family ATPase, partial [Candidatus Nanopelagicales bacterium]